MPAATSSPPTGQNARVRRKRQRRHQKRVELRQEEELNRRMELLPCTWAGQVESNPLDYHVVEPVQVPDAAAARGGEEEGGAWCSVM